MPTKEYDYMDKSLMYGPVSNAYSQFVECVSSWSMYGFTVIHDDQLIKGLSSDTDQGELLQAKNFDYSSMSSYWLNGGTWDYFYGIIMQCNSSMIALDNFAQYLTDEGDLQLNEQYKAETRFIRAYTYFLMTRLYGEIPVFTDNMLVDGIYRSTREKVYQFIDSELEYCASVLPAVHPADMDHPGAASKYSALGLKAKAAADMGNWDLVYDATETIINDGRFDLYTVGAPLDYFNLFQKSAKLCIENLFEAQLDALGHAGDYGQSKSGGWSANVQGPAGGWTSNGVPSTDPTVKWISGGWGFLPPSSSLINKMITRGETKRYETTIIYTPKNDPDGTDLVEGDYKIIPTTGDRLYYATVHDACNGKAYVPVADVGEDAAWGLYNNIRMIRYADILLLNAEARVNKGLSGDAPFNLVRTRAAMPSITGVTLQQIWDERDIELALEWGERYYDLTRTGRAGILTGYTEEKRFYPIPLDELDMNPNLAQPAI